MLTEEEDRVLRAKAFDIAISMCAVRFESGYTDAYDTDVIVEQADNIYQFLKGMTR